MQQLNYADKNNFSTVLDFNARVKEILDLTHAVLGSIVLEKKTLIKW